MMGQMESTRIDRWLWSVRLTKTRPDAAAACRGGHVRVNDQPAKPFKLKMIDPATSQVFPLGEEVTIGRAPGCSVPLADDTYVSQLHARIYIRDGKPFVEDLGSTNGTFLNRDRLSKTMPLRRGDKLQIGHTVLEIVQ